MIAGTINLSLHSVVADLHSNLVYVRLHSIHVLDVEHWKEPCPHETHPQKCDSAHKEASERVCPEENHHWIISKEEGNKDDECQESPGNCNGPAVRTRSFEFLFPITDPLSCFFQSCYSSICG